MASRWNPNPRPPSQESSYPRSPESPVPSGSSRRNRKAPSEHSSIPPTAWVEPAALDDNCAKYILSVMVLFLRQTASPESPLMLSSRSSDITFRDFESLDSMTFSVPAEQPNGEKAESTEHELRPQPSSNSVNSGKVSINSTIHLPATNTKYERTHMSMVKSSLSVNTLIAKFAGRIIFHISASNWNVVFARLRNKIRFLATGPEENPDTVDLTLMAHSALDRTRLVQVLNGRFPLLLCGGLA